MVNQDRNKLKKKCMGSHWESNPRPPTLAVDALTTELRLPYMEEMIKVSITCTMEPPGTSQPTYVAGIVYV